MNKDKETKVYLIGGGIASLAAAVYCIKDAGIKGESISIFDEAKRIGGSLDAQDLSESEGYVMRGIRMFEEKAFTATFDLMASIPSLIAKGKTLREEFVEFNKKSRSYSKARLLKNRQVIDSHPLGLSSKDRLNLIGLLLRSEVSLEDRDIKSLFTNDFFTSNFWYEFCTVFAFQPWHSAIEFRRYFLRFIQGFSTIDTLEDIEISPYNQYEFLVMPIVDWLKSRGVVFVTNAKVTDVGFVSTRKGQRVEYIIYGQCGTETKVMVKESDRVIMTLGSIVANSAIGSMHTVPIVDLRNKSGSWALWERIAAGRPEFGVPAVFGGHTDRSGWTSFTITFRDRTFFDLMEKFVHKKVTTYGGVNIVDSNWFMSVVLSYKPYFLHQPNTINLCWGYGLRSDAVGNIVKKKMSECTGEEILIELVHHLGFEAHRDAILGSAVCIPCGTPYITSLFLPRKISDRPAVVPQGAMNFAFVGQYCEVPGDVVFTVEYSIRSAQIAVDTLFGLDKRPSPMYKGIRHMGVLYAAMKTIIR
ncbi:MAG: 67 kDa myosin-cross-reactive antigen family protein, myosin-crossreactive antigen [Candidatus Wolfebacteria bacterium GW2011_GWB1_47_1]|nr:MAG: 67 kDa myosin-cross-reactive antigen family protein, myosin-crossreactive antigen [Candidatus Wolfebacteria bacterium GW2011_GWB1_47_1]